MERTDVAELHYIAHIDNLDSILDHGILSRYRAKRLLGGSMKSIANPEILARRDNRRIPGGLPLNRYANLFFNARNAMLYSMPLKQGIPFRNITVLRVDPSILYLPGIVITDINAAAEESPSWHTVEEGLSLIDKEELFAEYWTHDNPMEERYHRQRMMAEVLVPDVVPPKYILGTYLHSDHNLTPLSKYERLDLAVFKYIFFLGKRPPKWPYCTSKGRSLK